MVMLRQGPREPSECNPWRVPLYTGPLENPLSRQGRASGVASLAGSQTLQSTGPACTGRCTKTKGPWQKKKPTAGVESSPERLEAGYSTAEVHRHHGSQSRFGEKKDIRCSIAVQKKIIRL